MFTGLGLKTWHVLVAVMIAATLLLVACGDGGATPTPTATPTEMPTATPPLTPTSTPPATGPEPVTADIIDFTHVNLTVPLGTTVTWIQLDPTIHTTTSGLSPDPDDIWDSDFLQDGQDFSHTFDEVGTFPYFCKVHTYVTGTVTVGAEGTEVTITRGDLTSTPVTQEGIDYDY